MILQHLSQSIRKQDWLTVDFTEHGGFSRLLTQANGVWICGF